MSTSMRHPFGFALLCLHASASLLADGLTRELALDTEKLNIGQDWWKYIIIAFAALLIVYLLIRLTLYVCRLVGAIACIAAGILGAYFAQALLNPWLDSVMPENTAQATPVVSGIIGFLCCFLLATGIILLIRKPAAASAPAKKRKSGSDE